MQIWHIHNTGFRTAEQVFMTFIYSRILLKCVNHFQSSLKSDNRQFLWRQKHLSVHILSNSLYMQVNCKIRIWFMTGAVISLFSIPSRPASSKCTQRIWRVLRGLPSDIMELWHVNNHSPATTLRLHMYGAMPPLLMHLLSMVHEADRQLYLYF
jgi:hypothetical protein